MYWTNIGLIFVAGLNIGMAFLVWLRNPKNKINISFALAVVLLAGWTLGIAMFRESKSEFPALVWTWVQNGAGSLMVIPFFFFSIYFPYQNIVLKKWQVILIMISIFIMLSVVVTSNAWIKDIRISPPANDYDINFWGIGYFNIHFYFYLILAFYNLISKYKKSQGFIRKQLLFVILSTGVIALFGGIFGALIPLVLLRTAGPYWVGPYFSLPFLILIIYFIYKRD